MTKMDFGFNVQPFHIEAGDSSTYCLSIKAKLDGKLQLYDIK